MDFNGLNDLISNITTGVTGVITTLYLLAVTIGVAAVIVLSIITMFCNEQDAARYKRWRTNVIKAVIVALLIGAVFAFIKGIFGDYWAQNDMNNLI